MSIEQFKAGDTASPEQRNDSELLRLRNRMQYALAERHCIACSKLEFVDYILREIGPAFGELIRRSPELLSRYEKDPEAALAAAEKELHLDQTLTARQ